MTIEVTNSPYSKPPHDIKVEEALLGAMLITPDAVATAVQEIKHSNHFFKPGHRIIFSAIQKLYEQGSNVDRLTLSSALEAAGDLDKVGGSAELANLRNSCASPNSAEDYARIVKNNALLRNILNTTYEVAELCADSNPADAQYVVEQVESMIYKASEERLENSTHVIAELFEQTVDILEDLYKKGESITGVATGYRDLDELLSGLQKGALIIVGARPGMGKTSFALGAAAEIARQGPVLFFSMEMGGEQISRRLLGMQSGVSHNKLKVGKLSGEDWTKINQSIASFESSNLYIDDNPGLTVLEVKAKARRLKSEMGRDLGAIFVDYMQLMSGSHRTESRYAEVSEISQGLKRLAREMDCPVIALSQLSRALESRTHGHRRPQLSDLRESGSIEQDADVVLFLYRDEVYDPNSDDKNIAEVNVAKHRSGETRSLRLTWRGDITRFLNHANQAQRAHQPVPISQDEEEI